MLSVPVWEWLREPKADIPQAYSNAISRLSGLLDQECESLVEFGCHVSAQVLWAKRIRHFIVVVEETGPDAEHRVASYMPRRDVTKWANHEMLVQIASMTVHRAVARIERIRKRVQREEAEK